MTSGVVIPTDSLYPPERHECVFDSNPKKQITVAFLKWRQRHMGMFVPLYSHTCLPETCAMFEMPVWECTDGVCLGLEAPMVSCLPTGARAWSPTSPADAKLGCGNGGSLHTPATHVVLFCCRDTGSGHICGTYCERLKTSADGAHVCTLTGRVFGQRVASGYFGDESLPVGFARQTSHVKELTPSVALERAYDLRPSAIVTSTRSDNKRDQYFATAVIYILDYLQMRSGEVEYRRLARNHETVRQHILATVRRSKQFIDVVNLVCIAAQQRARCTIPLVTDIPLETLRSLAPQYATRVLALWATIHIEVPGGPAFTRRQSFIHFVEATLMLCQRGIIIRDKTDSYDVQLLSNDPVLGIISASDCKSPTEAARGKRICDEVFTLLQDAVRKHMVNPQRLCMDEMSASVELVPRDAFVVERHPPRQ